jgi:peptidoglycan hydrolase-like protein with peptidoglycan-binding domain
VPAVPAVPATPAVPGNEIEGCGNRTTGFSSATGVSCVGNTSTIPAVPATPATPTTPASSSSSFATTGVYNFGTKTLKNGSKGEPVKELQRFLNQVLDLGLVIDGKLGPKTIAVIKKWQKANSLKVDGLIGPKTKAKMNAMVQ